MQTPCIVQRKLINIASERAFLRGQSCFSQAGVPPTPAKKESFFLFKTQTPKEQSSWVIFHRFMPHTIRSSKPEWFYPKCPLGLGGESRNACMCGAHVWVGVFVECIKERGKGVFHLCRSSHHPHHLFLSSKRYYLLQTMDNYLCFYLLVAILY